MVHTRSLEEATSIQSQISAPVRAELLDRRAGFEWQANRMIVGAIGIAASRYGASVIARSQGTGDNHSLLVPLQGFAQLQQAGHSTAASPTRSAVVAGTDLATEVRLSSEFVGLQINIPVGVATSALEALTGKTSDQQLRFEAAVDTTSSAGASVLRLLHFMVAEANHAGSTLQTQVVAEQLSQALVYAMLIGLPHSHSSLLRMRTAKMAPCVLRAEEYMAARAGSFVSLAELAAISGVSVRTLHASFRAHRGYGPMTFLRERRFELARGQLLSAAPRDTVARIASACGFEHLGRFSGGYRKRFGETPSQTLRRGAAHRC